MATDLETLVVTLSANLKTYENAMNRASGIMNRQAREIERRGAQMQKRLDGIGRGAAQGLIAPLSGIGAALGVREIANYADTWTNAGNKIKAAATASNVQVRSLNDLKTGANAARTDLESYVDLYAKLIRNASGVAKSEQEIATVTETVAKAFKVGGASTNEQTAAILQLGQALGSGVLQGDELRSIRENAPVVAKAIANEMGVSISQLKELGAEGKITSDIVFRALINAQAEVERQFKSTNATISDGLTVLNNEFLAYIGNADASAGASRGLVAALMSLATNFGVVADTAVAFATVVAGALTGRALAGLITTSGNALAAVGALVTALRAGAPVAASFSAALGPIGILAGAAAASIYLLMQSSEGGGRAAAAHADAMRELDSAILKAATGAKGAVEAVNALANEQRKAAQDALNYARAQLEAAKARQSTFDNALAATPNRGYGILSATAKRDADNAQAIYDAALGRLNDIESRLNDNGTVRMPSNEGYGTGAPAAPAAKVGRKTADDRFREDLQATKDRTAALAAEQEMIGQSIAAQESRRLQLDLEAQALADLREEARRKGETDLESIQLAPEQVAAIKEVSDAYGQQAEALAKAQQAFADANDLARGFADDMVSGLLDGASAAETLANALDNVADKLLDMALNSLFDPNGGVLGGLFKGLTGLATGGLVTGSGGIGHAATGGHIRGPGSGTSDSIPMMLSNGEYVVNAKQAKKYAPLLEAINSGTIGKMAGGGLVAPRLPRTSSMAAARAPGAVTVSMPISIDARGADEAGLARVQQQLSQLRNEIPRMVVTSVANAKRRNVQGI